MLGVFVYTAALAAAPAAVPFAALVPMPARAPVHIEAEESQSSEVSPSGLAHVPTSPPTCEAPLRLNHKSRPLQRRLETALADANLSRYLRAQQLSVAIVDLTRADEIYYAGVNDDEMMYAASLPKIAILLTVAESAKQGKLEWTPEFDERLGSMITESSNSNATWGANLVGLHAIEQVMRDPQYCFYDQMHGGLWVGRPYAGGGESNRDPLKDISHGATARQAARFYTLLDREDLVSREWSRHLIKLMGPPKHHHKFVAGLSGRSGVTFVARKSGTWRNFHADSALIQHDDRRYVAVALSELRSGENVMHELIRLLDDLVMDGSYRRPRNS